MYHNNGVVYPGCTNVQDRTLNGDHGQKLRNTVYDDMGGAGNWQASDDNDSAKGAQQKRSGIKIASMPWGALYRLCRRTWAYFCASRGVTYRDASDFACRVTFGSSLGYDPAWRFGWKRRGERTTEARWVE